MLNLELSLEQSFELRHLSDEIDRCDEEELKTLAKELIKQNFQLKNAVKSAVGGAGCD